MNKTEQREYALSLQHNVIIGRVLVNDPLVSAWVETTDKDEYELKAHLGRGTLNECLQIAVNHAEQNTKCSSIVLKTR